MDANTNWLSNLSWLFSTLVPLVSSVIGGGVVALIKYRYDQKIKWSEMKADAIKGIDSKVFELDKYHSTNAVEWKMVLAKMRETHQELYDYYQKNVILLDDEIIKDIEKLLSLSKNCHIPYYKLKEANHAPTDIRDRDEVRRCIEEYNKVKENYSRADIKAIRARLKAKVKKLM